MVLTVRSQRELDKALKDTADKNTVIEIHFGTTKRPAKIKHTTQCIVMKDYCALCMSYAVVRAVDNAHIIAKDNSNIVAADDATVEAYDMSSVTALGNTKVYIKGFNNQLSLFNNSIGIVTGFCSQINAHDSTVAIIKNKQQLGDIVINAYQNAVVINNTSAATATVSAYHNSTIVGQNNCNITTYGDACGIAVKNASIKALDNSLGIVKRGCKGTASFGCAIAASRQSDIDSRSPNIAFTDDLPF